MTNLNNQNGRSMIEMLGVLAIIGVLSVGGIAGYSKAMLKYKTNKLIDGVTMLTTNIRTLYAQQKTFTGLDDKNEAGTGTFTGANAISMGVVPDELIKTTKDGDNTVQSLKNPFAGTTVIEVDDSVPNNAGLNRAFIIGVTGIPKEACMAMATADWGSNYSSGLIGMAIKHDSSKNAADDLVGSKGAYAGADCTASSEQGKLGTDGAICAAHMPLQVAEAAAACACAGSDCSVAIKYY